MRQLNAYQKLQEGFWGDTKKFSLNIVKQLGLSVSAYLKSVLGYWQMMFPVLSFTRMHDEELLMKKYISGDVEIYMNELAIKNAFTIPGFRNPMIPSAVAFFDMFKPFPGLNMISYFFNMFATSLVYFSKTPTGEIAVVDKPRHITTNVPIRVYITRGLYDTLSKRPDLRATVYMHEIGHWDSIEHNYLVATSELIKSMLLFASGIGYYYFTQHLELPPEGLRNGLDEDTLIAIILGIISISLMMMFIIRSWEYSSDALVGKAGMEEEYVEAFTLLGSGIRNRKNTSFLEKYFDTAFGIVTKIHNLIDPIIPILDHPSNVRRIQNLEDVTKRKDLLIKYSDEFVYVMRKMASELV